MTQNELDIITVLECLYFKKPSVEAAAALNRLHGQLPPAPIVHSQAEIERREKMLGPLSSPVNKGVVFDAPTTIPDGETRRDFLEAQKRPPNLGAAPSRPIPDGEDKARREFIERQKGAA